jgi:hypothetical protein
MVTALWEEARWGEDLWPIPFVTRLGPDGVGIDIWANTTGFASWGLVNWPAPAALEPSWTVQSWVSIACEVIEAEYAWGANRALGILSVANGGSLTIRSYDPDGILDPTNPESPVAADLFPGSYVRLTYQGQAICFAILDTLTYSNALSEGIIGGTDPVGVLSNIKVDPPVTPASTLRAFARQLVALTGYNALTVEPDPPGGDPAIGEPEELPTGQVAVWKAISEAATDALNFAWIGPDLVMRFRAHDNPRDAGLTLGLGGIPLAEMLGVSTADGIINDVISRAPTGPVYTVSAPESIRRFGRHTLDRSTRRVPDNVNWADKVLADRALASLEYIPGAVYPTSEAQLRSLVAMGGIDLVRIRTDLTNPPISADTRAIGLQLKVDPEGWTATVLSYVSASQWAGGIIPPVGQVLVPDIVGLLLSAATTAVQDAGLTLTYTELESASPVGTVLAQQPASGVYADTGSAVTASVAKAAVVVSVPVPNVAGLAEADALAQITAAGLLAGARSTATNALSAGKVTTTAPAAGTIVPINSAVAYTVSTGPVRVTRSVTSTKSALIALSNTGLKLGAGAATDLPAGAWDGWIYRSLVEFAPNLANVVKLVSATLRLRTSTQVRVGFGSNPRIRINRVTAAWTEGTSSTPSAGNAVVYPGPAATATHEVAASITRSENAQVDIDITAIVRQWLPLAAGGGGQVNRGLRLTGYTETSQTYTTEFDSDDFATAGSRPILIIVVDTV